MKKILFLSALIFAKGIEEKYQKDNPPALDKLGRAINNSWSFIFYEIERSKHAGTTPAVSGTGTGIPVVLIHGGPDMNSYYLNRSKNLEMTVRSFVTISLVAAIGLYRRYGIIFA